MRLLQTQNRLGVCVIIVSAGGSQSCRVFHFCLEWATKTRDDGPWVCSNIISTLKSLDILSFQGDWFSIEL